MAADRSVFQATLEQLVSNLFARSMRASDLASSLGYEGISTDLRALAMEYHAISEDLLKSRSFRQIEGVLESTKRPR